MRDEPYVTLHDIADLYRRKREQVLGATVIAATLGALVALTSPVVYRAEASFRDKGQTGAGMSESFSASMLSSIGASRQENEHTTTFKSSELLGRVIKKMHLNGKIREMHTHTVNDTYLGRIGAHLFAEYNRIANRRLITFDDPIAMPLKVVDIDYEGEVPYYGNITVTFLDERTFSLKDRQLGLTATASLGEPVTTATYSFALQRVNDQSVRGVTYRVDLKSVREVAQELINDISVKADKDDKTLIRITGISDSRKGSAELINALMDVYQDYKRDEMAVVAGVQLDYLSMRHKQLSGTLREMIEEHARTMSDDLLRSGFPNAQSAIDYLSQIQSQQQQRLLNIDLEVKRLELAKGRGYSHCQTIVSKDDAAINHLISEIRDLKKQSDNIDLTLNATRGEHADHLGWVSEHIAQINELERITGSAKELLAALENGHIPESVPSHLAGPKYLIDSWYDKLTKAYDVEGRVSSSGKQELSLDAESVRAQFVSYLQQMVRLYEVHARSIRERLVRLQNPKVEFRGIDLAAARELYMTYTRRLQELESTALQHEYIIEEIQHPDFEVTSLGTVLTDPISQEMIGQASRQLLALQETHARSTREQQRLRDELAVKKGFLTMHIKNAVQLLTLQQNLLRSKTESLLEVTLALLGQQVSLAETQLGEYLDQRIGDLAEERVVLTEYQHELNAKMAALPTKWSEERLIDQQLQINTSVSNEVARLIESKNLASNLEVSRSGPVDVALPPKKPKSPFLIPLTLFGAVFGLFSSLSVIIAQAMMRGMPASLSNLRLAGFHVSGSLSSGFDHRGVTPLLDQDLETVRAISAYLPEDGKQRSLLVAEGGGANVSYSIGRLLGRRGLKVIMVPLTFDNPEGKENGLLAYLEGTIDRPTILPGQDFDTILSGGVSRFAAELTATVRFADLVTELKKNYDWVIGVTKESPQSAAVRDRLRRFDLAVLSVKDEALPAMQSFYRDAPATFVVHA